jgi:signal transduction histidine kinase
MIQYSIKLLSVKFKNLSVEEQRKWTIVFLVNTVTIFIQLYYLYRFNFQTVRFEANFVIIPCLILNLLPLYFYKRKNFSLAAFSVLVPGTVDLIYLIFFVGGINAPGPFWLSILPFFYGAFFNKKGAVAGAIVTTLTYAVFILVDQFGGGTPAPYSEADMYWERIYNLINYNIILGLYFISYTSAFERSNKTIAESKELIDNLFRVVLHDITNPISAVKLRTRLLKKKIPVEHIDEILKVETSINKVIGIIDSLRNFKAIEDGLIEIPLSKVTALSIISEFYVEAAEKSAEKKINLKQNVSLNSLAVIECNPESLKNQVLANIFSNALKFSKENDVIEVRSFEDEEKVFIEIEDTGIGIPAEILDNLFRFDKPTSRMGIRGEQGTGYGLPITKYFVELMGGDIKVSSSEAKSEQDTHGTKFSLSFNKIKESL